ncbi:MAG: O-antigen ligase family protein [Candidatus Magasanikbacteria bacterium]
MQEEGFFQRATQYIFRAFLFLLPFQTIWIYRSVVLEGAKWQYGTLGFYGTELLLWLGVVCYMVWYLQQRKIFSSEVNFSWTKDRIFLSVCLAFLIYSFVSIGWAFDPNLAFQYSLWLMEAVLLISILISGPFDSNELILWFTGGGVLQALLAIFQFATQSTFALDLLGMSSQPIIASGTSVIEGGRIGRWLRAYGSFPHPNMLGGYLSFVVISLISAVSVRDFEFKYEKIIISITLMILAAGVFVSFSRAAWLVLIVTLIFTCFHVFFHNKAHSNKVTDSVIVTTVLFIILVVVSFPLVETRLSISSSTEVRSVTQRMSGIALAGAVLEDHTLLGVGANNYTAALIDKIPGEPGWFYQPVHNSFLLFLVEFGLVGTLLLIAAVIAWYYFMFHRKVIHPDDAFYLSLIIFAVFILGNLDHYLASSFVGIMMLSTVIGLFSRIHTQRVLDDLT